MEKTYFMKYGNVSVADAMEIGPKLKEIRVANKISRAQASRDTGISVAWNQKFEQTTNLDFVPNLATITPYCEYLGIMIQAQYTVIVPE